MASLIDEAATRGEETDNRLAPVLSRLSLTVQAEPDRHRARSPSFRRWQSQPSRWAPVLGECGERQRIGWRAAEARITQEHQVALPSSDQSEHLAVLTDTAVRARTLHAAFVGLDDHDDDSAALIDPLADAIAVLDELGERLARLDDRAEVDRALAHADRRLIEATCHLRESGFLFGLYGDALQSQLAYRILDIVMDPATEAVSRIDADALIASRTH
jgi:hypothetical protein